MSYVSKPFQNRLSFTPAFDMFYSVVTLRVSKRDFLVEGGKRSLLQYLVECAAAAGIRVNHNFRFSSDDVNRCYVIEGEKDDGEKKVWNAFTSRWERVVLKRYQTVKECQAAMWDNSRLPTVLMGNNERPVEPSIQDVVNAAKQKLAQVKETKPTSKQKSLLEQDRKRRIRFDD